MNIDSLTLKILEKDHPSIFYEVSEKLEVYRNASNLDFSFVHQICAEYCDLKGITIDDIRGKHLKLDMAEARKELIGVILMFFNPQKIEGISECAIPRGLRKELSIILSANAISLTYITHVTVAFFTLYKEFRNNILQYFYKIKEKIFVYN